MLLFQEGLSWYKRVLCVTLFFWIWGCFFLHSTPIFFFPHSSCVTANCRVSAGLGPEAFCWPFIDFAFSFSFLILAIPPLLGAGERQNPFESVRRRSRLYKRSLSEDGDWTDGVSPRNNRDFIRTAGSIALSLKRRILSCGAARQIHKAPGAGYDELEMEYL